MKSPIKWLILTLLIIGFVIILGFTSGYVLLYLELQYLGLQGASLYIDIGISVLLLLIIINLLNQRKNIDEQRKTLFTFIILHLIMLFLYASMMICKFIFLPSLFKIIPIIFFVLSTLPLTEYAGNAWLRQTDRYITRFFTDARSIQVQLINIVDYTISSIVGLIGLIYDLIWLYYIAITVYQFGAIMTYLLVLYAWYPEYRNLKIGDIPKIKLRRFKSLGLGVIFIGISNFLIVYDSYSNVETLFLLIGSIFLLIGVISYYIAFPIKTRNK